MGDSYAEPPDGLGEFVVSPPWAELAARRSRRSAQRGPQGSVGGERMAGPFSGRTCVLCRRRPSTKDGEHVWPKWYLEDPPGGQGPYKWLINDQPLLRRDGLTPVVEEELTRVRLPACRRCNAELNDNFELAAKTPLRRLLSGTTPPDLTPKDTEAVTRWLLKTWLLLAHPEVFYAHPLIEKVHRGRLWPQPAPPEYYEWMVTDAEPPLGLSLWIYRAADRQPGETAPRR